jgi:hypothetical protein
MVVSHPKIPASNREYPSRLPLGNQVSSSPSTFLVYCVYANKKINSELLVGNIR